MPEADLCAIRLVVHSPYPGIQGDRALDHRVALTGQVDGQAKPVNAIRVDRNDNGVLKGAPARPGRIQIRTKENDLVLARAVTAGDQAPFQHAGVPDGHRDKVVECPRLGGVSRPDARPHVFQANVVHGVPLGGADVRAPIDNPGLKAAGRRRGPAIGHQGVQGVRGCVCIADPGQGEQVIVPRPPASVRSHPGSGRPVPEQGLQCPGKQMKPGLAREALRHTIQRPAGVGGDLAAPSATRTSACGRVNRSAPRSCPWTRVMPRRAVLPLARHGWTGSARLPR